MVTILGRAPVMDAAQAQRIVADLWGLADVEVRELGSHQDRNFLITAHGVRHVLKVANSAVADDSLDAQNAAMLALVDSPLSTPAPITTTSGGLRETVSLAGTRHSVRLLSYVSGTPMTGYTYLSPEHCTALRCPRRAGECRTCRLRPPGVPSAHPVGPAPLRSGRHRPAGRRGPVRCVSGSGPCRRMPTVPLAPWPTRCPGKPSTATSPTSTSFPSWTPLPAPDPSVSSTSATSPTPGERPRPPSRSAHCWSRTPVAPCVSLRTHWPASCPRSR